MGRGKTKPARLHQPDAMPGYTLPRYPFRAPPELVKGAKAPKSYPVAIVGAGLAGLTSALELASRGIDCVLLDDDDTVGASGLSSRGICYAKRTLEILDRFGAAERVRKKGVTWNEGDVYRGEERLYRFNLQPEKDQKFPAFVNLQQFYIEQYLVEALADHVLVRQILQEVLDGGRRRGRRRVVLLRGRRGAGLAPGPVGAAVPGPGPSRGRTAA